jgi:hypothetical protein
MSNDNWDDRKTITRVAYIIGTFLLIYIAVGTFMILHSTEAQWTHFREDILPTFSYILTGVLAFIGGFLIRPSK